MVDIENIGIISMNCFVYDNMTHETHLVNPLLLIEAVLPSLLKAKRAGEGDFTDSTEDSLK